MDVNLRGLERQEPLKFYSLPNEVLKITGLGLDVFTNCSKLFGFTQLGNFLSYCKLGVNWICHRDNFDVEKLQNKIKESSINSLDFLKSIKELADIVNFPLQTLLKNDLYSKELTDILTHESKKYEIYSKNLRQIELQLDIPNVLTNTSSPLTTSNEKQILLAGKINSLIEFAGLTLNKLNIGELT